MLKALLNSGHVLQNIILSARILIKSPYRSQDREENICSMKVIELHMQTVFSVLVLAKKICSTLGIYVSAVQYAAFLGLKCPFHMVSIILLFASYHFAHHVLGIACMAYYINAFVNCKHIDHIYFVCKH